MLFPIRRKIWGAVFSRGHLSCFSPNQIRGYAQLPPRRKIQDAEIEENFLKGSGPGGQKINKTSSAVQLKHLPTGIVIKCQETRSRSQNRDIARRLLSEKLEVLEQGEQSRVAIKSAAKLKKKASADKKKRRKYRKLEEGKQQQIEDEDGVGEEDRAIETNAPSSDATDGADRSEAQRI